MSRLSIIMPVLDEGEGIAAALDALADLRALGTEVIVVDGGSRDATIQRARMRADRVISAPRGRALQMNALRHRWRRVVPSCRYPPAG
jgi:glycosyltransferase involved in cell wall biosynthesis